MLLFFLVYKAVVAKGDYVVNVISNFDVVIVVVVVAVVDVVIVFFVFVFVVVLTAISTS